MTALGADIVANAILPSILGDKSFPVPSVDLTDEAYALPEESGPLYVAVDHIDNADLTERVVGGNGTFDTIMAGIAAHLRGEYEANRITGADYTKAYIALTEAAIGNAVQFLLGREQAYWQALAAKHQAQTAQIAVVAAKVQLATAKAQLQGMSYEALTNEATYAITKLKLAGEDAAYGTARYQLDKILPKQLELVSEQVESQRSQTLDTRTDGTTVVGSVGKQKALYQQQIVSYQRDAEVKAAKLFTDAWITQKTIDEGLLAPTGFQNASVDVILTALKTNNGLI